MIETIKDRVDAALALTKGTMPLRIVVATEVEGTEVERLLKRRKGRGVITWRVKDD